MMKNSFHKKTVHDFHDRGWTVVLDPAEPRS